MRPTSCVSPGPQTRCGRTTTTGSSLAGRGGQLARRSPSTRRTTRAAAAGDRRRRAVPRRASARRVRPTASTRGRRVPTPARRAAAMTLRGAVDVDAAVLLPRADDADLRGRVDDGIAAVDGALRPRRRRGRRRAPARRRAAHGRRWSTTTSSPRAQQRLGRAPRQQARAAGDEHPHHVTSPAPASTAGRPGGDGGAIDLGVVADVDRQRARRVSTAATGVRATAPRTAAARSLARRGPSVAVGVLDDDDELLAARRPDADRRGAVDAVERARRRPRRARA